ncbi:MAG: DUF4402 domain-containing protein [Rhodothermaceae bacterium]|nr:DUF4402 domain-containing protein [Rhodothermaceae bacterium]MYG70008.1 DUF4402 domain-containing protein [Rhodothermaceae bacterium]MYJ43874.1 DUF4402 domain-containing protein [Rhodothermaceae bacterium]
MRMNTILFVILIASPTYAQAVDTEVRLELRVPQATCALMIQEHVDFGAVTGRQEMLRLSPSSNRHQTPGRFTLSGQYASEYMVSIDFPSQITGPGTPLAYEGQWEQATAATGSFKMIPGLAFHQSAEEPFERHFRVGGWIRGLSTNTPPGLYSGQISITVTCN